MSVEAVWLPGDAKWRIELEHPQDGWVGYAIALSEEAAHRVIDEMRPVTACRWRAIRIEHRETVEDW